MHLTSFKRMAMLCAILVLTITSISAFIRLSNAGLGCVDWPQCYGQNFRQAQQGVAGKPSESATLIGARMVHRIAAVAALVLIIAMLVTCLGTRPVPWQACVMTIALLLLALFLAVLGRWSSSARVPAVAIGNLLGGFAMLALCWRLIVMPDPGVVSTGAVKRSGWLRTGAWLGVVVLLCQIALGGLVSASYSGLSCTGLTACAESSEIIEAISIMPAQAELSIPQALNPWREPVFSPASPANSAGAIPHMAHRYGAFASLLVLLPLGLFALRNGRRRSGLFLLALLAVQAGLGIVLIAFALPLWGVLAHNLIAAMMLATVFSLI